jgi:hypothetical protein
MLCQVSEHGPDAGGVIGVSIYHSRPVAKLVPLDFTLLVSKQTCLDHKKYVSIQGQFSGKLRLDFLRQPTNMK